MSRFHQLTDLLNHPSASHLVEFALFAAVLTALGFLLFQAAPTTLLSFGLGAEIFSGNWKYLHIPLGLDRILIGAGLISLVFGTSRLLADRRIVLRPIHLMLLAMAAWATASAIAAQTIGTHAGIYALLDRLGYLPFLFFTLAPIVFGQDKQRRRLLAVLLVVGAYLGITAVMEGVGLTSHVLPSYIRNPNIGLHYGRARGPFLESVADGLSLFMCGIAAAVGLVTWRQRWLKVVCVLVAATCGIGVLFTLTRAVWLGAGLGLAVGLVAWPGTRRRSLALILAGTAVVGLTLLAVPGLQGKAQARANSQSPVWDRLNTDRAALTAAIDHPLGGIGWQRFSSEAGDLIRQAGTYPLTGTGLEVHNVFLSHAVELGLPAALLWVMCLVGGVGGAILRRGPPELLAWRVALLSMFVCFVVVANLGPLGYAFPNLLLWTWAGITGIGHNSRSRPPAGFEPSRSERTGAPSRSELTGAPSRPSVPAGAVP